MKAGRFRSVGVVFDGASLLDGFVGRPLELLALRALRHRAPNVDVQELILPLNAS